MPKTHPATPSTDETPIVLEQPRTGGSFLRQEDGSLSMIEGSIEIEDLASQAPAGPDAAAADGALAAPAAADGTDPNRQEG